MDGIYETDQAMEESVALTSLIGKSPEQALLRTHLPTEDRIARLKAMAEMD